MPPNGLSHLDAQGMQALLGGAFEIERRIGDGGQGVVFRAIDGAGKLVALKLYDPTITHDARIEREFNALKGIASEVLARPIDRGIVHVHGTDCGWVSWEFVEGVSLADRLQEHGPLSRSELVALVHDGALAIQQLWELRIVHRDIKPANVIFAADGRAVIIDLGFARFLDHSGVSQPGVPLGTPGYMSPEQMAGERTLTNLSDIFSLGVTVAEAVGRCHPTGRNQLLLLGGPVALPNASEPLTGLCASMTDPDPTRRPALDTLLAFR